jgi:hypothetical protein
MVAVAVGCKTGAPMGGPMPVWPYVLFPQQYTLPLLTPHEWLPPALMSVNVNPPMTATGRSLGVALPLPN